jgi:cysteine desulfurase
VSIQYANSETGVIQPVREIANIIRNFRAHSAQREGGRFAASDAPLFHMDAVQAFQFMPCNVRGLGVDMLTLSAHKIYGPKGIGLLYIRHDMRRHAHDSQRSAGGDAFVKPLVFGGGQERGMRSGTEHVPAIAGFAEAVRLAEKSRTKEARRIAALRDALWSGISRLIPDAEINGAGAERLPHMLNVYMPGRPAQEVCVELDMLGIAASPGSACSSRRAEPSRPVAAMNLGHDRPTSSIRFSFGKYTTGRDIAYILKVLKSRFTVARVKK